MSYKKYLKDKSSKKKLKDKTSRDYALKEKAKFDKENEGKKLVTKPHPTIPKTTIQVYE